MAPPVAGHEHDGRAHSILPQIDTCSTILRVTLPRRRLERQAVREVGVALDVSVEAIVGGDRAFLATDFGLDLGDLQIRALPLDAGGGDLLGFLAGCAELGLCHRYTRTSTPRTNGKAERFIQTALRE